MLILGTEWFLSADKKFPDFSAVQSGSSSSAPRVPGSLPRTYTVVAGDSLSKIAKRVDGDPQKWQVIYEAKRSPRSSFLLLPLRCSLSG